MKHTKWGAQNDRMNKRKKKKKLNDMKLIVGDELSLKS
jgi:hypothetical protein